MKKKTFFVESILILLLCFLTFRTYTLKRNLEMERQLNSLISNTKGQYNTTFPKSLNLVRLQGQVDSNLVNQFKKKDFTLLVIFDPTGCGSCLNENILWEKLNNKFDNLQVITIVNHNSKKELSDYLNNSEIALPVLQDTTLLVNSIVLPTSLPVKVLLDRTGKVHFIDYVRSNESGRKKFVDLIRYYLTRE